VPLVALTWYRVEVGWRRTMAPYRRDARFHSAERLKHKRKVRSKGKGREGTVMADISLARAGHAAHIAATT
jgi:hypothetical protein